jgi:hypothetical protein
MFKVFVDTSVWRHWFTLKAKKSLPKAKQEEDAKAFEKIFNLVLSHPKEFTLLYNDRVENELPDEYRYEHPICFEKIKSLNVMEKSCIPLSRANGTYKADGSIKAGGNFGGSLREILSISGHNHEGAFRNAKPNLKRKENLAHTKPRKKEFDIEHLESALEAEAEVFLTTDYKLMKRLIQAQKEYPDNRVINMALKICFPPVDALTKVETMGH